MILIFVYFQYGNLIDDSSLPAARSGAIVAASTAEADETDFWVTSNVLPESQDLQTKHRISLAYRVVNPSEADSVIQFALLGDLAKFEIECTPGEVSKKKIKFTDLSASLKMAAIAADVGQGTGVFPASDLDENRIQEILSDKSKGDVTVLEIRQAAMEAGVSGGLYGLQGNKSCTVSNADYVRTDNGVIRRSTATLSTASVAFSVPWQVGDLRGNSQVNVDSNGKYAVKRARFEPETQPDGILKWSVSTSQEKVRNIGGYRTNVVPGFSGILEDPADRWKRDIAILILGAFIGWFGGSLIEAIALKITAD